MNLLFPLPDPVVVKELGGMSRRGRTFFGRIFYVAIAGILVYSVASPLLDGGATPTTSEYAFLGRKLFDAFTWLQMLFLPLTAAVAAADVVHREARQGTLQMLLLTPLTGDRIVAGKWKAVMLETLTLALSSSPAMAISVYLGGVGVEDIAWCFCLSMVLSAIAAAMAIHYSLRDRTVVEAAFRAYLVLQLSAIPYGIFTGWMLSPNGFSPGDIPVWIHPYCAWAAAANPARSGPVSSHGWIGATLVSLWVAWLYLGAAGKLLNLTREASKLMESPVTRDPQENPNDILWREPPGPVWESWPLLWKECALRQVRLVPAARAVLLILFSLLTLACLFGEPQSALVQLFVLCPVALILGVAVASGHFALERERRGFEMLLSTPLRTSDVVGAKLLSGVMGAESVALAVFIAIGFAVLLRSGEFSFWIVPMVGAFLAFSYVLASAVSMWSRSYRTAFVTTAALLLFLLVGIPVLMNLIAGSALAFIPAVQFAAFALHPIRVFFADHAPELAREQVVLANLVLYLGGTLLLVGGMMLRFRAIAQGR
ncbi:MAG: ABC transporter permease subunit [Planctomycetes bacterium]|nr:ABC transporter permease subunit [Planctomycetota bacterium]